MYEMRLRMIERSEHYYTTTHNQSHVPICGLHWLWSGELAKELPKAFVFLLYDAQNNTAWRRAPEDRRSLSLLVRPKKPGKLWFLTRKRTWATHNAYDTSPPNILCGPMLMMKRTANI